MDHVSFINLLPCVDLDHDYILVSIIKQSMHLIGQNIDTFMLPDMYYSAIQFYCKLTLYHGIVLISFLVRMCR